MATRKKNSQDEKAPVVDYRHQTKRKNIPPAGLAAQGKVSQAPKLEFAYNPHLPPVLRSDPAAESDQLPELLRQAGTRPLPKKELRLLAEALRNHEPWLEWTGKREKKGFEVDPVALHIHERISTQAILKVAARESVQRDLFADPQLEYQKAVQFYQYDVDWTNRMILGDSLQVIASLARRETLAGKVQMIYVDPPYGIKFASNFQPEIGKRDVKDTEADLTREPEMVKAYRDTWTLGVHSYLAYLRDRLMLCKELLTDTGSIFVQISYENLHRVRAVLDEVFGAENCCAIILMRKSGWSATTPGLLVVQEANSNGHVDITIEAEHAKSVTVRLVEAKIYSGPAYHVKGIEQLLDRYLTGREGQGWILTYVRKDNIKALMVKIRGYLDLEKPCRQQAECEDHRINWAFASKHAHSSGEEINITHMGCNLFYC